MRRPAATGHATRLSGDEGPDDMPAHVRAILTKMDLSLPIRDGRCALGTWQGIDLYEHRTRPDRRQVLFTLMGEPG